jgi:hypothetical protein
MHESYWRGSATATAIIVSGQLVREGNYALAVACAAASIYWMAVQWKESHR